MTTANHVELLAAGGSLAGGGFKEALQDNGVATIYDLHAVVQMNEPRQEFLTLGRACGMTTSEISKLYKAARNSHQQAQQAASQKEAERAQAQAQAQVQRSATEPLWYP